jgi:hypothetical protein
LRRLLTSQQRGWQVVWLGIEGATTHRWDQQRVATCIRQQGMKEQQAAQCKGAAGAVHGSRLTSEKGAGMPVQRNVLAAHYEITSANLTKSLLTFCCTGLNRLYSGGQVVGRI